MSASRENARIANLNNAAKRLVSKGDLASAAEIYTTILAVDAAHLGALTFLSMYAKEQGDIERSINLLQKAIDLYPENAVLRKNMGMALLEQNRLDEALEFFTEAVALEPHAAIGYLYTGRARELKGNLTAAVMDYARAMQLQPELEKSSQSGQMPDALRQLVAAAINAKNELHHEQHLEVFSELQTEFGEQKLNRVMKFIDYLHGKRKIEYADELQKPSFQYFPDLPAMAWYDRKQFSWCIDIEKKTKEIRDELLNVLSSGATLSPYVDDPTAKTMSVEWKKLFASTAWSAFHLYKEGRRVEENCSLCPITASTLESIPLATCRGQAPEAFFSILKAGTHIPPHVGLANTKLAVHLPLLVPEHCGIRVGRETRHWQEGKCLIFDDSFEHEAWNKSEHLRAVLIFEIWNPNLTEAERISVRKVVEKTVDFNALCSGA